MSGTGSLTKTGAGTLTLNVYTYTSGGTASNYSGGIFLNQGTLNIDKGYEVPSPLTFTGNATLQAGANVTGGGGGTLTRSVTIGTGLTATFDMRKTYHSAPKRRDRRRRARLTWTGAGTGVLRMNTTNTYGGGTTISSGTLQMVRTPRACPSAAL